MSKVTVSEDEREEMRRMLKSIRAQTWPTIESLLASARETPVSQRMPLRDRVFGIYYRVVRWFSPKRGSVLRRRS